MKTNRFDIRNWRPPAGLNGAALWLAVVFVLSSVPRLLRGSPDELFRVLPFFAGLALAAVALLILLRWIRRRLLWSLRNKLVVTYLLIGLAPVVLMAILALIAAYIAVGQFSIHLVDSRIQEELGQIRAENAQLAEHINTLAEEGRLSASQRNSWPEGPIGLTGPSDLSKLDTSHMQFYYDHAVYLNGAQIGFHGGHNQAPLGLPPWAAELKNGGSHHLVLNGDDLYLAAVEERQIKDGRRLCIVSSIPVDETLMDTLSRGLGRVRLLKERISDNPAANKKISHQDSRAITGGATPNGVNLADVRVRFLSTLSVADWKTGERGSIPVEVVSRPSLLYEQLFGSSLGGVMADVYRIAFFALCVLFVLIELVALIMAIRLSRTITASVADLYEATQRIDRGDLSHRIGVRRADQLAALSLSFNTMTGSLQRLLAEEKEKDRMQNELAIAQEVQANLFPRRIGNLERLELHGVCRPARTVSGDYYDFLVFQEEARGNTPGRETGLLLAVGDISGKGISAALLMATLYSAVRAYRFTGEAMADYVLTRAGSTEDARRSGSNIEGFFHSPGRILALLNRHLYRSTQPEKYATLFLADYDAADATLTYSNAGHLPPLVIGRNGGIRRLDRGGTVVGLIDGARYDEDRFQMAPGDILVAYSDGVTEPENDFGEFGEERLIEVVQRYRDEPLPVISAQVMRSLDAWIGAQEQPDDITLVLARQL